MKKVFYPSRRQFMIAIGLMGTSLAVGINVACTPQRGNQADGFTPNAWITISSDGKATIVLAKSEMGQGVMTALPMLVAEELNVAWDAVFVVQADSPLEPAYGNQTTLGSGSVRRNNGESERMNVKFAQELFTT